MRRRPSLVFGLVLSSAALAPTLAAPAARADSEEKPYAVSCWILDNDGVRSGDPTTGNITIAAADDYDPVVEQSEVNLSVDFGMPPGDVSDATLTGIQARFPMPAGLTATSGDVSFSGTGDFDTASVTIDGSDVVADLTGSLALDGTDHDIPTLNVRAATPAVSSDTTYDWALPEIDLEVRYLGVDLKVECRFDEPVPFATTTVNPNHAPVGDDIRAVAEPGSPVDVTMSGSDVDRPQQALTYTLTGTPANGSATQTDATTIRYTSAPTYNGWDAFTYTVEDSLGARGTATISVYSSFSDYTPPAITIGSPVQGRTYELGSTVPADFTCGDSGSNNADDPLRSIDNCRGDVVRGSAIDTGSEGAKTFTVTAVDDAEIPHTDVVSYYVLDTSSAVQFNDALTTDCSGASWRTLSMTAQAATRVNNGDGPELTFEVGFASVEVPRATRVEDLRFRFSAPENGSFSDVEATGGEGTVEIEASGDLVVTVPGPYSSPYVGSKDSFTPASFKATIAIEGEPGAAVTTQFDTLVFDKKWGRIAWQRDTECEAYGNSLTETEIIDTTPPGIALSAPVHGTTYDAGETDYASYSASDDDLLLTTLGSVPNGSRIDTSRAGPYQVYVAAADANGNNSYEFHTYAVIDPVARVTSTSLAENSAVMQVEVRLSVPSTRDVTVDYVTSDGTALAGSDYSATSGTLTLPAGSTIRTVTIGLSDDNLYEGDENFDVDLTLATNASLDPTASTAKQTILDNEGPVSVYPTAVSVTEGDSGSVVAQLPVVLSGASASIVTVSYETYDYTATTAAGDYVAASGTLTFTPSDTLEYVPVTVNGDTEVEGVEYVWVALFNASGASIGGYGGLGVVTIADDD